MGASRCPLSKEWSLLGLLSLKCPRQCVAFWCGWVRHGWAMGVHVCRFLLVWLGLVRLSCVRLRVGSPVLGCWD